MEKTLSFLPANEIEAYGQIMTRIRGVRGHTSKTAIRTITWIFCAARPLQMNELLEALSVEEQLGDVNVALKYKSADIIEMCHSLVVHEESSGIVRFIHFTVQEFFKIARLTRHQSRKDLLNLSGGFCVF